MERAVQAAPPTLASHCIRRSAFQSGSRRVILRSMGTPPAGRSLADAAPLVAAEWHPSRNGDLTPVDVFPGSDMRVWWLCAECGHEWETKIGHRTRRGQGCRYCAAERSNKVRAIPQPGESLAEVMPALVADWHPSRNQALSPYDVLPGSAAMAWWLCATCGHEWETNVYSRGKLGRGCKKCGYAARGVKRATPKPGQSFADRYPAAAAEWHPTRNGDLKPTDVRPASGKRVWWLCAEGHEWSVDPADRQRGEQCPTCAERQRSLTKSTPKPGLSLQDVRPDVAAEWHPTKNAPVTPADVNPGSKQKRWWICLSCGHEWHAQLAHRAIRGDGCPGCRYAKLSTTKATPKPGESLAEKDPELASQWHPTLNAPLTAYDVRPRGRASAWWLCPLGHVWKAKIAPRAVGVGCPECSTVGVSERQVRLEYELAAAGLPVEHGFPPIAVDGRRSVKADIVLPSLRVVVEYDGSYYHRDKPDGDRAQTAALESVGWTVLRVREAPLPPLGGHEVSVEPTEPIKSVAVKVLRSLEAIGYVASHLSKYLDDPEAWADREAGEALYKYRAKSIASEFPYVAEEFDPGKNNGITPDRVHPGSNTKFVWTCRDCSHEWRSMVWIRTAGHGCPNCAKYRGAAKRAAPPEGGSFGDLFPESAAEWHPTLNAPLTAFDVKPASDREVWWQCERGHEWQARVVVRRRHGRCRECRQVGAFKT